MILRPRTRQRIVGPAIQRLWNFHPEHIRDGPADGVPITITARPLDVAGTTDHEYFVHLVEGFESTLMTLIRSYISRHGYNNLTRTRIRNLPFFLFPTETGGLGEIIQVKEGATTLSRLTVDTVQSIFETSQSNTPREIMDLMWTLVLNPVTLLQRTVGGRAATAIPKWLGKVGYSHTWKTHTDRMGVPLNCASFALANWLNSSSRSERPVKFDPLSQKAISQIKNLHRLLGFGERVTMFDLKTFVDKFPTYQLVMIQLNVARLEASLVMAYDGEEFDPTLINNQCILINFNDHWSVATNVNPILKKVKNGGTYRFCNACLRIVQIKTGQTTLPCHQGPKDDKEEEKPLKPCNIDLCCMRVHPPGENCPNRSCRTCHMGFPKDKPHRCLVMPSDMGKEHPHNKYWNETEKQYDFCVDANGDGTVPAFFSYDMETMTVEEDVTNLPTEIVEDDLEGFTDQQRVYAETMIQETPELQDHNSTGKIQRYVANLIVVTNIFTCKVPKVIGDDPYKPDIVVFKGPDCVVEFVEYLMAYNKGRCYAFAHNGAGFDGKFIFEAVLKMQNIKIGSILRGSSFMSLDIKPRAGRANKTYFLDSMLHLSGSLSSLLKGYFGHSPDRNLRLQKGYFPHKFNTLQNQDYVGPLPHIDYYGTNHMKMGGGDSPFGIVNEFQDWYAEEAARGDWDFQKKMLEYCIQDTVGLAALLVVYMETSIPKGGIPLMKVTAPSFVHQLILQRSVKNLTLPETNLPQIKKDLKEQNPTWDKEALKIEGYKVRAANSKAYVKRIEEWGKTGWVRLVSTEYNFVRESLRGGRTETRCSFMELSDEEQAQGIRIKYQDVVSLYPSEQMTKDFPVGSPKIHFYDARHRPCYYHQNLLNDDHKYFLECDCPVSGYYDPLGLRVPGRGYTGGFLDLVDCTGTQPTASSFINDPEMFGYVCVDLTPPSNLYHPVIQIKKILKDENGVITGEKCQNNLVPADHKKLYLDTPTLKKALQKGYKLDFVYRFDKYRKGKPAWLEAAMEFYVDKERTSGDAPKVNEVGGKWSTVYEKRFKQTALNERDAYVSLFNAVCPSLGDKLQISMEDPNQFWGRDEAQRKVFKIFNNCGWGKHAQRPIMPKAKTLTMAQDYGEMSSMFQNLTSNIMELRGCAVFSEGRKIMFTTLDKNSNPNHHTSYLPAGAMVPAYGRLTLLEGLEKCGERVAMCDTDSIVYKTSLNPTENIPESTVLGGWEEEGISKEIIKEFVGYGPKCYSIQTTRDVKFKMPDGTEVIKKNENIKLKGIRQTISTQGITHESMRSDMLYYLSTGNVRATAVSQWGIKTDPYRSGKVVQTSNDYTKDFKLMDDDHIKGQRVMVEGIRGAKVYPFGYRFT